MNALESVAWLGQTVPVALVALGVLPLLVGTWQYLFIGLHGRRTHLHQSGAYLPRTAVVIPAWNEEAVIGASIERLLAMDYPADRLRIYVVDDASTDGTPEAIRECAARHPGAVIHVRRLAGGDGKARALNCGLEAILVDAWAEAILITDADVQFEPLTLRRMARHLADPGVGSVSAYIREGSRPAGYLNRFIAYEYVTAQAAARRSQNVLGALACLAGGAQLHSRANLMSLGGRIDPTTLAEDTVTTFQTQLHGMRAVFDPAAVTWAEEPETLRALWKQRLRWARGNLQVTQRYLGVFFRPGSEMGGLVFGLAWFSILLQPLVMIVATISLVLLLLVDPPHAWATLRLLWIANAISYTFTTTFTLLIDPATARRCWREGILFPGLVSVALIVYSLIPGFVGAWLPIDQTVMGWFLCLWLTGCMAVAWLAMLVERGRLGRFLSRLLIYLAGYGAFLCVVTLNAYVQEWRGTARHWDKTAKSGRALRAS
jgi:cellulose synthase/poly-beta-1,6-N-acetylglucosamine synthase-like glycosyltransferase